MGEKMSKQMNTLPAKETVVGATTHPTILFSFMAKHRMVTLVVVALLILTAIIGILAVRGIMNTDAQWPLPRSRCNCVRHCCTAQ
jgi:hypothetical protein